MSAVNEFKEALAARLTRVFEEPRVPAPTVATLRRRLDAEFRELNSMGATNPLPGAFADAIAYAGQAYMDAFDCRLVGALAAIAPALCWARRPSAEPGSDFYRGHANARIIGHGGLAESADVTVGLSLMAPNITYPDHQHPPEEIYLVLGPGQWRQNADPWWEPGFGGAVYNPPGILHAMRSGAGPLLAIWLLNN